MIDHYHLRLAAAYIRGKLEGQLTDERFQRSLGDLSPHECESLFKAGQRAGLKLHRFKKFATLPRIQKVLGILKSMQPQTLLDIGTGRGVFLWPLLDTFPGLPVTCSDLLDHRVVEIKAVANGGMDNLKVLKADAARLPFYDNAFDGVCLLETLEHLENPQQVIDAVCRVADRFVVLSVPSKPDNNPEHRHLFNADHLRRLLSAAGGFNPKIEFVLNHIVVLATRQS